MLHRATTWLKLLRLPNVFTAVADVAMGYFFTHFIGGLEPISQFVLLIAASCCLYLSGMVLNDVFDADVDAVEQPHRPIPAGDISRRTAAIVGWSLLIIGVAITWKVAFAANDWRPGVVGTLLGSCILLYDGALKRTRLAPLVMGECRLLNVLLGMSVSAIEWEAAEVLIAVGIGVYIIGVTLFARTDAQTSTRKALARGFIALLAGIGVLSIVPWWTGNRPAIMINQLGWWLLWAAIALIIARRCIMAIFEPSPQRVQAAVRNCVHSLIVLDAAVTVGYTGPYWGFAILCLLFPTMLLTLWLNAT
jgi:4-hydroxybenzoate polyprenyltransferase